MVLESCPAYKMAAIAKIEFFIKWQKLLYFKLELDQI